MFLRPVLFLLFFEGFEDFFVILLILRIFFLLILRVLCVVGLLSFGIWACVGVSSCSLREVGLVGPEARVLLTSVLLLSFDVADVGGLEAGSFCFP